EALRSLFLSGALNWILAWFEVSPQVMAQRVDQLRMPIYGILLIILMLTRPQGLFGTKEIWDTFPRWFSRRRKVAA
ncbi:MAG: hypothetical protein ACT4TC_20715, partial [Myxococcaceae bacterium]